MYLFLFCFISVLFINFYFIFIIILFKACLNSEIILVYLLIHFFDLVLMEYFNLSKSRVLTPFHTTSVLILH